MSYFQDLSDADRRTLQTEFEASHTTDKRRVEIISLVRDAADETQMGRPCPKCKHHPFLAPHDEALIEGHVYSHEGVLELQITGYCEYCFDLITKEPDEDEDHWSESPDLECGDR